MASGHAGSAPSRHRPDWPMTVVSLIVGASFFALWFWLLPSWLGFQVEAVRGAQWHTAWRTQWRWLAVVPSVLGFAVALRCIWDFGRTGHGTPAPMVPPKKLVVVGLYRYVRNPMYVGFFAGWIGLWIVFGRANWAIIAAAVAVVLGVSLFVQLYEEPTLRKAFGPDYEEYSCNVHRWLPRLHPWESPGNSKFVGHCKSPCRAERSGIVQRTIPRSRSIPYPPSPPRAQ
jgi:protein-S-isoprenylcysteine O-methyltransferase Ste14